MAASGAASLDEEPLDDDPLDEDEDSPMAESDAASLDEELLDDDPSQPGAPAATTAAIADAAANPITQGSLFTFDPSQAEKRAHTRALASSTPRLDDYPTGQRDGRGATLCLAGAELCLAAMYGRRPCDQRPCPACKRAGHPHERACY
jgi:hypothetical protein